MQLFNLPILGVLLKASVILPRNAATQTELVYEGLSTLRNEGVNS